MQPTSFSPSPHTGCCYCLFSPLTTLIAKIRAYIAQFFSCFRSDPISVAMPRRSTSTPPQTPSEDSEEKEETFLPSPLDQKISLRTFQEHSAPRITMIPEEIKKCINQLVHTPPPPLMGFSQTDQKVKDLLCKAKQKAYAYEDPLALLAYAVIEEKGVNEKNAEHKHWKTLCHKIQTYIQKFHSNPEIYNTDVQFLATLIPGDANHQPKELIAIYLQAKNISALLSLLRKQLPESHDYELC